MKVTGSSTVEYIEVEGHDYERTGCGTWTVRMGESMEPVYDPADLERQYHEIAKIALPCIVTASPGVGRYFGKSKKIP